jgi:hypothetical protein
MISVPLLFSFMFQHWVADFVLQSNNMATKKSTSNLWLTLHVLTYTCVMGICAFIWLGLTAAVIWMFTNGILHWITDYYTSRVSSRLFKENENHYAFVVIGFDQLIHFTCILITTWILL